MDLARFIYLAAKEDELLQQEKQRLELSIHCKLANFPDFTYSYFCTPVLNGVTIEGLYGEHKNDKMKKLFKFMFKKSDKRLFYSSCILLFDGMLKRMKHNFQDNVPDTITFILGNKKDVLYFQEIVVKNVTSPDNDKDNLIYQTTRATFKNIFGILTCMNPLSVL